MEKQEITPEFEAIIKEASEAVKNFSNAFTGEYDKVQNSFESYCRVNGIITPADMQDFFNFLCLKFPDEPTGAMVNEAKKPHNYKLFGEYKQRLFDNPKWDDLKERNYWLHSGEVHRLVVDTKQFNGYVSARMEYIHEFLYNKQFIDCTVDTWLYWFGLRDFPTVPDKIKWLPDNQTLLVNIIQQLTGKATEKLIRVAFDFGKYQKPTKRDYQTKPKTKPIFQSIDDLMKLGLNLKRVK